MRAGGRDRQGNAQPACWFRYRLDSRPCASRFQPGGACVCCMWSCVVPRSPAKPKPVAAVWQISRVAKKAIYLGQVEAADAEMAIKRAIEKYDIKPEHQARLAARRIVTAC